MAYEPRTYRRYTQSSDLVSYRVNVLETDLFISSEKKMDLEIEKEVIRLRHDIESYISKHPDFKNSLKPVGAEADASDIIKDMAFSTERAGVGPMAAIAGAMAEYIGKSMLDSSPQIIIENGGDIFISSKSARTVGIYAGLSKFSGRMGLKIEADETPCGVCTSSGTVGHSLSFGKADAAVIIAKSVTLADAVATAVCNRVKSEEDIYEAVDFARYIKDVDGVLIIFKNKLGAWGNVKLVDI